MTGKQIDDYLLTKLLGSGSFGEVFLTQNVKTLEYFATKVINKHKGYTNTLMKEIALLQQFNHENIIRFESQKETVNNIYLMLEYCNGGELLKVMQRYISEKKKPFPEVYVQHIMRQIFNAFYYLHTQQIMHRDIKLENILVHFLSDQDKQDINMLNAQVKVIDFGFAKSVKENEVTASICGNALASDPRIVEGMVTKTMMYGYDDKVDLWSLGIVTFQLLVGKPPFEGNTIREMNEKIQLGMYAIPKDLNLSLESVTCFAGLLQHDDKRRYLWNQIFELDFLNKNVNEFTRINYYDLDNNNFVAFSTKNFNTLENLWNKQRISKR